MLQRFLLKHSRQLSWKNSIMKYTLYTYIFQTHGSVHKDFYICKVLVVDALNSMTNNNQLEANMLSHDFLLEFEFSLF